MKTIRGPITATIVYGLVCGLAFIPAVTALGWVLKWPLPFNLTIWAFLAGYALLLGRVSGKGAKGAIFPLLALAAAAVFMPDRTAYLALILIGLAWIRSGTIFQGPTLKNIAAEIGVTAGGAALVSWFTPQTPTAWALGVWLFILTQSLYFLIHGQVDEFEPKHANPDPFLKAKRQAEAILSDTF